MKGRKASHQGRYPGVNVKGLALTSFIGNRKLKHYVKVSTGRSNIVFGTILSRQTEEEKAALRCFKSMKTNRKNTDWNKSSLLATPPRTISNSDMREFHSPVLTRDHSRLDCF